jgi:hypothetical protein
MENRLSNSSENKGDAEQNGRRGERERAAFGPGEAAGCVADDNPRSRPPYGDLGRYRSRGLDFAQLARDNRRRDSGFTREWDQTIPVVTRGPGGDPGGGGRLCSTHRGKGPRGYRRSDDCVREDVCERLSEDRRLDASDIEVTISHGEITLDGTVESTYAKRRAEDAATDVAGVHHVQNNLRARAPSSNAE